MTTPRAVLLAFVVAYLGGVLALPMSLDALWWAPLLVAGVFASIVGILQWARS